MCFSGTRQDYIENYGTCLRPTKWYTNKYNHVLSLHTKSNGDAFFCLSDDGQHYTDSLDKQEVAEYIENHKLTAHESEGAARASILPDEFSKDLKQDTLPRLIAAQV